MRTQATYAESWHSIELRKFAAPKGEFEDQPLFALYRLYECFVLDKVRHYRNQLEYFWRQNQWPVSGIPDPQDTDPARYAFLAGVTYLMARSFNARVKIGLTRDAHPIMTMEEAEKAKSVPDELRPYEEPPAWATRVPPLEEVLRIPADDESLLGRHPLHQARVGPAEYSGSFPIRIVCVSDTHNQRPEIPPRDVLIHAGDLSDNGSFEEVQAGLDWLAAQPHRHKILVAGNHDVLLDEAFLARYPERRYGNPKTAADLVWPSSVVYLNNRSTTLEIMDPAINPDKRPAKDLDLIRTSASSRKLRLYGSPYTVEYVPSAFQYPRADTTFWDNKIPSDTDIVVTHGPPRLHLDT
ncbi:hypothetical protein DV735_g2249, partial [Chaetothyriales sp. CBS 134920]